MGELFCSTASAPTSDSGVPVMYMLVMRAVGVPGPACGDTGDVPINEPPVIVRGVPAMRFATDMRCDT